MGYSTYLKHKWLNALANTSFAVAQTYVSLHTGTPGDTGANEVAGGSPAYARKAINWNPAAAGSLDSSNAPVFDIPAGTTVAHAGFWDASTAGNWLGSFPVTNEVFASQGTYTLSDADLDLNA